MSENNKNETPAQQEKQIPSVTSSKPQAQQKEKMGFDTDLIKKYPRANRRLNLHVESFGLKKAAEATSEDNNSHSVHISPHGLEFRTATDYPEGSLLKIHVALPDYWSRKQQFVDYGRVDNPEEFKVLCKVLRTEDVGKRGKKKLVIAQTLIMDEVDEKVLKTYLQDG